MYKVWMSAEQVLKSFYRRFQSERTSLFSHIQGITAETNRATYASLLLKRLMVVYFLQQHGLLDGDTHYLCKRHKRVGVKMPSIITFCSTFSIRYWQNKNTRHVCSLALALYPGSYCLSSLCIIAEFKALCQRLMHDYQSHARHLKRGVSDRYTIYVKKSKLILDEIGCLLGQHYGFSNEEINFIINYDLKYRIGEM
ncbi:MAG: hypothetical protein JO123_09645 [Ktedonobacteraceae bacterium]|nr:hypothetical protein [Ktedonobacteraceae bacterium]